MAAAWAKLEPATEGEWSAAMWAVSLAWLRGAARQRDLLTGGLLVLRRADRKSGVPFGPWMLLGCVIGLTAGEAVWDAYLGIALGA